MALYFFLQCSVGVLYGIVVASVSITKFHVISQLKENWETLVGRKHISLCKAAFLFLFILRMGGVRLISERLKKFCHIINCEDNHVSKFVHFL
jgi:hypothetical protein